MKERLQIKHIDGIWWGKFSAKVVHGFDWQSFAPVGYVWVKCKAK